MTASKPLQGIELIDCVKANSKQGFDTCMKQCGYGNDVDGFRQKLQQACQEIGVEFEQFNVWIQQDKLFQERRGVEFAPETASEL